MTTETETERKEKSLK